jgi:membrane-associated phospholipid phosphatase
MIALLATLQLLGSTSVVPNGPGGEPVEAERPETVTPDGGEEVPTAVPKLTPGLAPILAPELVPDGGVIPLVAPPELSVYRVDLPVEATVTGGSVALFVIVDFLVKPTLEGDVSCRRPIGNGRCDPSDLTAFDRYSVGRSSPQWQTFGDIALYASLLLPVVYLGLESLALPTQDPWGDWGNDLLVVSEAMALTGAMQTVMKFAFRRPRPVRYTPVGPISTFDQELSFPSGHTALVSAATTALTTTIFLRHPKSKVRFLVLGGGVALSALTAISRVESGQHFPTDVIVGVLIGGFAGFAVPYLHRKTFSLMPAASFDPKSGTSSFAVGGVF